MRTALVTGASSGIGYEFSKILARENYNLILVSRNKEKLSSIKHDFENKYKIKVSFFVLDLTNQENIKKLYKKIKEKNITINVLINDAGFGDYGKFIETNWEKEKSMIELNIVALTLLTKLFSKDMVKRKEGMILNVASMAAFFPGPLMAIYYASKAYVLSFSQAVNNELKGTGVTITTLCPGNTKTGFQKAANMTQSKSIKGKKLYDPKDIAEYGYKVMINKKPIAIPGFQNKIVVFLLRLASKSTITNLVKNAQEKNK